MSKVITMHLTKIHNTLATYEEVDGDLQPVKKPAVSAIYLRKKEWEVNGELPMSLDIAFTPVYVEK